MSAALAASRAKKQIKQILDHGKVEFKTRILPQKCMQRLATSMLGNSNTEEAMICNATQEILNANAN